MFQFKIIDDILYFFLANTGINALEAYSFNSAKVEKIISFPQEGPNTNLIRENFYVHNWDSLFFIDSDANRVLLFDSTATLLKSWPIIFREEHNNFTISTQEYYFRPYYDVRNTSIGFWIYPPASPFGSDYARFAKAVDYNVRDNTYVSYGQYPANYFDEPGTNVVFIPTNGYQTDRQSVLYYGASSQIYLYDKSSKNLLRVIDAKSKHLPGGVPPLQTNEPENEATYDERIEYYRTTGDYEYMFSNEDYSYHYRIVKHPGEFKDATGRIKTNDEFVFSIMIFDRDFRLINEIDFPAGIYDFRQSFAYGKQLYICLNNPMNEGVGEDHLLFQALNLHPI